MASRKTSIMKRILWPILLVFLVQAGIFFGSIQVSGVISEIRSAVVEGNTLYYLRLDGGENYYAISAADDEGAVILNVGDAVQITFAEGDGTILKARSVTRVAAGPAKASAS